MWLSLFLVAFLGAAAYFQLIQGLTSAAIMCVVAVLSLGLSFATHEYVAQTFLMGVLPDFAYPVALIATFIIPLGVVRVLLDMYVPRANHMPILLDRAVAAVAGLCSAIVMTGVLALAIQMVPWGGTYLGFTRVDPATPLEQNNLWLKPDRLTAQLVGAMSFGAFRGNEVFWNDHPDLVTELGWVYMAPQGVRCAVPEDAARVSDTGRLPFLYDFDLSDENSPQVEPVEPKPGHFFARVTVAVTSDTADKDDKKRFVPASVRLVGTHREEAVQFPAIAIANPDDPSRYVRKWKTKGTGDDANKVVAGQLFSVPSNSQIEVAFEVPEGFEPRFLAYKWGGRATLSATAFRKASAPGTTAADTTPPATTVSATPPPRQPNDRISGVRIQFGKSHFGPDLPFEMTAYSGSSDVASATLAEGHVKGDMGDQGKVQQSRPFSKLDVPQGKQLLHLNVDSLQAGSLAGKVMNFAVQTVENYILEDDRGNQLLPVGKYATAFVGGTEVVEVQFFPQVGARTKPFTSIKSANLKKDYQLVYLYLMDSGAKAMRFTPGQGKRSTDLSGENLVAP